MQVLYFAWLRERIGTRAEDITTDAPTVRALIDELRGREDRYALAFSDLSAIRVSIDQQLVELDAPLNGAREVAFFPPMTGG